MFSLRCTCVHFPIAASRSWSYNDRHLNPRDEGDVPVISNTVTDDKTRFEFCLVYEWGQCSYLPDRAAWRQCSGRHLFPLSLKDDSHLGSSKRKRSPLMERFLLAQNLLFAFLSVFFFFWTLNSSSNEPNHLDRAAKVGSGGQWKCLWQNIADR